MNHLGLPVRINPTDYHSVLASKWIVCSFVEFFNETLYFIILIDY